MSNYLQHCPICKRQVEHSNHFPDYVCNACAENATDAAGEPVIFYHARFISKNGFQGYYRRNNELVPFAGNVCFIKGVKCYATNDYEGGIVIQPSVDIASPVHSIQQVRTFAPATEKMQSY